MSRAVGPEYSPVALESGDGHGTTGRKDEAFLAADAQAAECGLVLTGEHSDANGSGSSSKPVAAYDYPASSKNTCRCGGGRLVGRLNVMREVAIPEGEEHPKYRGLRTRIVWVIPSGWPMLFVTFGIIVGIPIVIFATINNEAVAYGSPFVALTMVVASVSLARTTFKDPGIFPRYSVPQGADWHLCQRTQSYRPPGIVFDHESELLIDKIDHFCPWTGTTIAGNNFREFQVFVVTIFTHLGVTAIVALVGVFLRVASATGSAGGDNATTVAP